MKKPTIIIADDHPMLLKGLVDELTQHNFNIVGTATNGAIALELIDALNPSIAILDIEMPLLSGIEIIKKCQEKQQVIKFIILTSHKERHFILKAKKLNIKGYLLKDEPFSEIYKCISEVHKGNTYFSKTFDAIFSTEISPELDKLKLLSPSERTIVRMVAQNLSSAQIAEQLTISPRTVQKHRANIIAKLDLPPSMDPLLKWTMDNSELLNSI